MSIFTRIFGGKADRARYRPLYDRIVAAARDPLWYREGAVPDTLDGRFDMVAALFSLLLLRLEREGKAAAEPSALLAEIFIEDMEGTIRQLGIGDLLVGKHVGRMMGALGGRLGAFRAAAAPEAMEAAVRRNVFRDAPPSEESVAFVARRLERFRDALAGTSLDRLLAGKVPQP